MRLWSRAEVLARPCPILRSPGVYAWYFRTPSTVVPLDHCVRYVDLALLYIGISPKQPPRDGRPGSQQTLASRVRYHLLRQCRGLDPPPNLRLPAGRGAGPWAPAGGGGKRLTFTVEGERRLSEWMQVMLFVTWTEMPQPWLLEAKLFRELALPLKSFADNEHHAFCKRLASLRSAARDRARALPILAR